MRHFRTAILITAGAVLSTAPLLWAESTPPELAAEADVVFLGEQHDNPEHHRTQAQWTAALEPSALVFEMLTEAQASGLTDEIRADATRLEAALGWHASGWPDFSMYFPIFAAAPDAVIFGAAVPRDRLGDIMEKDLTEVAEPEITARYGLNLDLPADEQAARLELQRVAHCDALPEEFLPRMVEVQRLRDATIAEAARRALAETGGPVVVITGNGHAREDWGAPFLLRQAASDIAVFSLGQGEAGSVPEGGFTEVVDGPGVDRGDPCAAFN